MFSEQAELILVEVGLEESPHLPEASKLCLGKRNGHAVVRTASKKSL